MFSTVKQIAHARFHLPSLQFAVLPTLVRARVALNSPVQRHHHLERVECYFARLTQQNDMTLWISGASDFRASRRYSATPTLAHCKALSRIKLWSTKSLQTTERDAHFLREQRNFEIFCRTKRFQDVLYALLFAFFFNHLAHSAFHCH